MMRTTVLSCFMAVNAQNNDDSYSLYQIDKIDCWNLPDEDGFLMLTKNNSDVYFTVAVEDEDGNQVGKKRTSCPVLGDESPTWDRNKRPSSADYMRTHPFEDCYQDGKIPEKEMDWTFTVKDNSQASFFVQFKDWDNNEDDDLDRTEIEIMSLKDGPNKIEKTMSFLPTWFFGRSCSFHITKMKHACNAAEGPYEGLLERDHTYFYGLDSWGKTQNGVAQDMFQDWATCNSWTKGIDFYNYQAQVKCVDGIMMYVDERYSCKFNCKVSGPEHGYSKKVLSHFTRIKEWYTLSSKIGTNGVLENNKEAKVTCKHSKQKRAKLICDNGMIDFKTNGCDPECTISNAQWWYQWGECSETHIRPGKPCDRVLYQCKKGYRFKGTSIRKGWFNYTAGKFYPEKYQDKLKTFSPCVSVCEKNSSWGWFR